MRPSQEETRNSSSQDMYLRTSYRATRVCAMHRWVIATSPNKYYTVVGEARSKDGAVSTDPPLPPKRRRNCQVLAQMNERHRVATSSKASGSSESDQADSPGSGSMSPLSVMGPERAKAAMDGRRAVSRTMRALLCYWFVQSKEAGVRRSSIYLSKVYRSKLHGMCAAS